MFLLKKEMWKNHIPNNSRAGFRLSASLFLAAAVTGTIPLVFSSLPRGHFLVQFTLTATSWVAAVLSGIFSSGPFPSRHRPGDDLRLSPLVLATTLAMGMIISGVWMADITLSAQARQDFRILVSGIRNPSARQEKNFSQLITHLARETAAQEKIKIILLTHSISGIPDTTLTQRPLRKHHGNIICWQVDDRASPGDSVRFRIHSLPDRKRSEEGCLVVRPPLRPLRSPMPAAFTFKSEWESHARDLALFISAYIHLKYNQPRTAAVTLSDAIRHSVQSSNGILHLFRGNAWFRCGKYNRMHRDAATTVSSTPSLPQAWNQRAVASMCLKDPGSAVIFLQNAAPLDPEWPVPLNNLGTVLAVMNQVDKARAAYRSAMRRSPEEGDSLFNLGILNLEQNRFKSAEEFMTRIITRKPEMADVRYFRGISLFQQRLYERAVQDFSAAVRLQPLWPQALHDLGVTHARRGRFQMAIHAFSRVLAITPKDSRTRLMRGLAYHYSGEHRLAESDCTQLLKRNRNDASALRLRGNTRFRLGDPYGAAEDFSRLSRLFPLDPIPFISLGKSLLEADNPIEAERNFSRALQLNPEQAEAWLGRSMARWMRNRRSSAIADLDHALASQPENFHVWLISGIFHRQLEEYDTAIRHIRKSMELNPGLVESRYQLALTLFLAARIKLASREFNRVIARNPEHDEALNFRGVIRQVYGNISGSIQDFNQAISLVPGEPAYRMSLANTRLIVGDTAGAVRDFHFASRLLPGDPIPLFFAGQALEDAGNHSAALVLYRNALGSVQGSTLPLYRALMRRIRELERDLNRLNFGENP